LGVIAQTLLFIAVWLYYQPWSHILALAAFVLFALYNMIIFIIFICLLLYLLYQWLEMRRRKKILEIAKKTPAELAGIRNQKPELEIVIKGRR